MKVYWSLRGMFIIWPYLTVQLKMCFINVASFINSPSAPFAVSISLPLPSVSYGYQMIMSCRLLGGGRERERALMEIPRSYKWQKLRRKICITSALLLAVSWLPTMWGVSEVNNSAHTALFIETDYSRRWTAPRKPINHIAMNCKSLI